MIRCLICLTCLPLVLCAAEEYTYWIEPCPPDTEKATGCKAGDPELGKWAFETWQRESGGALTFRKNETEEHARIRLRWAGGQGSLYGETEPVTVDGRRGAVIFVLPDTSMLGPEIAAATRADPLLRDSIVYLTCLHESGHALGLAHTAAFADIMYSFRYGGDIVGYFGRYRRLLQSRADMPKHSGISDGDRVALKAAVR
ncbi:MAG: matrixin family metalloprotease [Acidobacteriota bacterium]